jgi:hypothetical protein
MRGFGGVRRMDKPYWCFSGGSRNTIPCKSGYYRDTCTSMFIAALFTIAKLWKQLRCPITDE